MDEQHVIEEAHRFLRDHTTSEMRFDEHLRPVRYVFAPDGRLVMPVMHAMLDTADTVLFVPECAEGAMEVQVTLHPLDPNGPDGGLTDRWRIYHGDPPDAYWAIADIDAARYGELVLDGEALMKENPLAGDEAKLCRTVNKERRDALTRLCRKSDADVAEPLLVGVDPLGFDVRRRFDVVRVPAVEPMLTIADAERVFGLMCADG